LVPIRFGRIRKSSFTTRRSGLWTRTAEPTIVTNGRKAVPFADL
jgi:hypothetical protein